MKKFLMCFVLVGMVLVTSCGAKKVENGISTESGPAMLPDGPSATDRAETTVATTDSTSTILLDSSKTQH